MLAYNLLSIAAAGMSTYATGVDSAARISEQLSCHARDGLDLAGDAAYVWGSNFLLPSAADCCSACARHAAICGAADGSGAGQVYFEYDWKRANGEGKRRKLRCPAVGRQKRGGCNAWIWCSGRDSPVPGQCFSFDIHVHKQGECWLKHESNVTAPIAAGPVLPRAMLAAPRKEWPWAVAPHVWPPEHPPARLNWVSGVVAPRSASVWRHVRTPGWQKRFCNKHQCEPGDVRKE